MKKLLAALLMIALSISICIPAFADEKSEINISANSAKSEKEIKEYLNNLKPPKDIKIDSVNFKDNIYSDLFYRFSFDEEISILAREKDLTNTNRYIVYTDSIFWLDENFREFAKSSCACYCEEGLSNEATFLYFYEDMFPECIYESELYFFADDCKNFKDKYGYNNYGFDMTDHYISVQVRYKILDTLEGKVYYSEYTDPVRFGKGYTDKADKPIKSFKDSPLPLSNVRKYNFYYMQEDPVPYYCFKFKDSKEVRKACENNSGNPYLKIEVKTKDGEWLEAAKVMYEYLNPNEYIMCYLPDSGDNLKDPYDHSNISFRFRFEFYLNEDEPYRSKPYGVGPYQILTIKWK